MYNYVLYNCNKDVQQNTGIPGALKYRYANVYIITLCKCVHNNIMKNMNLYCHHQVNIKLCH